ncbi:MAG: hypothetical protein SFW08_04385 [Gemmatimonadaceae bacterium]|nr:hypothetical protein [Gemmatimonadaceae bacterium]
MRARSIVGGVASLFVLVSALAHGAGGWPVQRAALAEAGADAELIRAMAAGWLFGSAAMAVFGILGLRAAWVTWRGKAESPWPMRILGGGYALFGIATIIAQRGNWFFLVFVVPGLAMAASAASGSASDG